jgi:transcriptional regulator with XRE-family HTH domain
MARRHTVREDGPDPIDVHVGHRLRQARLLAGMSQDDLGAGVGVSFQAVQKYEHGENRVSASRLLKAAELLNRPISFFFEELGGATTVSESSGFSREEIKLVRHFRQIPDERLRAHLLQMTKQMGTFEGAKSQTKPRRRKARSVGKGATHGST